MNKFYKSAILAVAAAMVSQAAHATQTPLELGFTSASAQSDYIIDLGAVSLTATPGVTDLSSDFSATTFNSVFSSSPSGVSMGVVSGNSSGVTDIYATQVRVGGAGDATVAGSSLATKSHSSTVIGTSAAAITGVPAFPTTAGTGVADSTKSYSSKVEANVSGSFFNKSGIQPAGALVSGTILEDLWEGTVAGGYSYLGYFTFNYGSDLLTFTSAAVPAPEPAAYGALAGLGVLALSLRRQFSRKNA
jgi:hypothetical protein